MSLRFGNVEVTDVTFNGQTVNTIQFVDSEGVTQETWNYAPGKISSVTATVIDDNQINVTWSTPSGGATVNNYTIETSTSSDFSSILSSRTSNDRAESYTGLTANTTYYYRVKANGDYANTEWAYSSAATTAPAIPSLSASTWDIDSILINYGSAAGASNLYLDFKVGTSGTWTGLYALSNATSSVSHNGLTSGTTYYYRIRSKNSAGKYSRWSSAKSAAAGSIPSAPSITTATTSGTNITLGWTAVSNASGYYVYEAVNGGNFYYVGGVTTNTLTRGSREYGTTYEYKVRAYKTYSGTDGLSAESNTATLHTVLATVATNDVGNNKDTQGFTATWTALSTSDVLYYVQYKTSGGNYVNAGSTTGNTFNVTGLTHATTYTWRVVATHSTYAQSISSERTITTNDLVMSAPSGITETDITDTSVTISWNAVTGASGYTLNINNQTYNLGTTAPKLLQDLQQIQLTTILLQPLQAQGTPLILQLLTVLKPTYLLLLHL